MPAIIIHMFVYWRCSYNWPNNSYLDNDKYILLKKKSQQ